MKKNLVGGLLTITTFLAVSSASGAYVQGDLIVGFTAQSGNDLLYDLGQRSALTPGQTWNLSGPLSGAGLTLSSSTFWGVIGNKNSGTPRTAYITADLTPGTLPSAGSVNNLNTSMNSLATSLTAGNSLAISSADANSWNQKTIVGPLATDYVNNYQNPNTQGFTSVGFWQTLGDNSTPTQLGTFSMNQSGFLTFAVVPEPTTGSLLGCGAVVFVFLRGKLSRIRNSQMNSTLSRTN